MRILGLMCLLIAASCGGAIPDGRVPIQGRWAGQMTSPRGNYRVDLDCEVGTIRFGDREYPVRAWVHPTYGPQICVNPSGVNTCDGLLEGGRIGGGVLEGTYTNGVGCLWNMRLITADVLEPGIE